jgi:CRISPR-associated protein Cas2
VKVLICYDIPDDRKRDRLAKELQSYGDRVQKSVFEVLCDNQAKYRQLKQKIARKIDPAVDSVRFYRLCRPCEAKIEYVGLAKPQWDGLA